jgi:hypothetical protein
MYDTLLKRYPGEREIPPEFGMFGRSVLVVGCQCQFYSNRTSERTIESDFHLRCTIYTPKIIQALSLSADVHTHPPVVYTVEPLLVKPDKIDAYVFSIAYPPHGRSGGCTSRGDLLEGFQSGIFRVSLFPLLFFYYQQATPQQNQTRYSTQLLAFPFTQYKQSLIHAYALQHPGPDTSFR